MKMHACSLGYFSDWPVWFSFVCAVWSTSPNDNHLVFFFIQKLKFQTAEADSPWQNLKLLVKVTLAHDWRCLTKLYYKWGPSSAAQPAAYFTPWVHWFSQSYLMLSNSYYSTRPLHWLHVRGVVTVSAAKALTVRRCASQVDQRINVICFICLYWTAVLPIQYCQQKQLFQQLMKLKYHIIIESIRPSGFLCYSMAALTSV